MTMQEDGLKDVVTDCQHMTLDSKLCGKKSGFSTITSMGAKADSFPPLSPADHDPRVTPSVDLDT